MWAPCGSHVVCDCRRGGGLLPVGIIIPGGCVRQSALIEQPPGSFRPHGPQSGRIFFVPCRMYQRSLVATYRTRFFPHLEIIHTPVESE